MNEILEALNEGKDGKKKEAEKLKGKIEKQKSSAAITKKQDKKKSSALT